MKKYILIVCAICFFSIGTMGQMTRNTPVDKTFAVGLKGGVNMPRMYYFNNPALKRLPQSLVFTPMGGVYLDIPITDAVNLSPEVMYVKRGTDMKYVHANSGAQVHYSISTSYVDLRLPLELIWGLKPYFQPFVTVGAETGMCMFGKIQLERTAPTAFNDTIAIAVDSANMSLIHAGVFAGLGFRSKVNIWYQDVLLKFTVAFHQGVVDSYSPYEKNGVANAVNVHAYQITGQRWPQGLEVTLGVSIPLESGFYDACSTFSRDRNRRRSSRGHLFGF